MWSNGVRQGILYVISSPSGGGKTSLVKVLLARDPLLSASISHTTRPPRPLEENHKNYHFVDPKTFAKLEAEGAFIESANVFGYDYGTSREGVETVLLQGKDVILAIDWQGGKKVREKMPCKSIFILPPSRETLLARLNTRGEDKPEVIQHRMALAEQEMSHYSEYDYVVINDDFETALQDLAAIFRAERLKRASVEVERKKLIENLFVRPLTP